MSESKKNASEPDEEPRKPGRPPDRVSLKPLEFEEALADLLATGPPEKDSDEADEAAPYDRRRGAH